MPALVHGIAGLDRAQRPRRRHGGRHLREQARRGHLLQPDLPRHLDLVLDVDGFRVRGGQLHPAVEGFFMATSLRRSMWFATSFFSASSASGSSRRCICCTQVSARPTSSANSVASLTDVLYASSRPVRLSLAWSISTPPTRAIPSWAGTG